jgi:hypothetical protein
MTSDESLERLLALLAQAGVDLEQPTAADVARTWAVMRAFAAEPVDDAEPAAEDGDGILAQYGVYEWEQRGEHFELDMTRQFTARGSGAVTQLHCTFRYASSVELRGFGEASMWSFGMELDDFFDEALRMPGFAAVHGLDLDLVPVRLDVEYEAVS